MATCQVLARFRFRDAPKQAAEAFVKRGSWDSGVNGAGAVAVAA